MVSWLRQACHVGSTLPTGDRRVTRTSNALRARDRIAVTAHRKKTAMIPLHQDSGTVGALVRRYRRMAGLTQEELADKAGLSVRAVRNVEQDKVRRPRRSTLQRLASSLGLSDTDKVRLVAAARIIEPPSSRGAPPEFETASWSHEWFRLQPVLAQLIDRFRPDRVLVVPVFMTCRDCCARAEEAVSRGDRPWHRRPATLRERQRRPGAAAGSFPPWINGQSPVLVCGQRSMRH
jgi:transcriptional regulator with XRE-family HTH domain